MAANNNSFANLLIQTFQELSSEQKKQKKPSVKPTNKTSTRNNRSKSKWREKTHANNPTKVCGNESENESDSESESSSDDTHDTNENDALSNLEDFVVSQLRSARNQKMLISELGLKVTDTFNKSINQISGLKSRDFFNKMKKDKLITIKEEKTENGALSFAHFAQKKESNGWNLNKESHQKQAEKRLPKKENRTDEKMAKPESKNSATSQKEATPKIRSLILSDFLNGKRSKIMLSAISAYCYKSVRMQWKKVMEQKPKEFVNDMVNDGLVCLDTTIKNNSTYPFITLNSESDAVKEMKRLLKQKEDNSKKSDENGKVEKSINENEIILRNLIVSKLKNGGKSKVFVSTIGGIALNHFEKRWDSVMQCSVNELIAKMAKDKLITIKGSKDEQFIVSYEANNNKKRRLEEKCHENEKEPKRKKHKQNKQNDHEEIVLPAIKLRGSNGIEMAQKMIEKLKNLENNHNVHFHFDFN